MTISKLARSANYVARPTTIVTAARIRFLCNGDGGDGTSKDSRDPSTAAGRYLYLHHCKNQGSCVWNTHAIVGLAQRHYQLSFVAVELFFVDRSSVFVNLHTTVEAARLATVIRNQVNPPLLGRFLGRRPVTIMRKTFVPNRLAGGSLNASNLYPSGKLNVLETNTAMIRLKDAWINREISNFDYLMKLNSIAGRTYNDLGQYPVFPWVLSDYHSPELDLTDPHSFRDLKYPMGAQNKKMRVEQQARYRDLQEAYDAMHEALGDEGVDDSGVMPPFHWGSHYSVAGFVLWYLLRLEPFTSLHVQLQDGKFDKADRIFSSIAAAYEGCTNNPSDVKELVRISPFLFLSSLSPSCYNPHSNHLFSSSSPYSNSL